MINENVLGLLDLPQSNHHPDNSLSIAQEATDEISLITRSPLYSQAFRESRNGRSQNLTFLIGPLSYKNIASLSDEQAATPAIPPLREYRKGICSIYHPRTQVLWVLSHDL